MMKLRSATVVVGMSAVCLPIGYSVVFEGAMCLVSYEGEVVQRCRTLSDSVSLAWTHAKNQPSVKDALDAAFMTVAEVAEAKGEAAERARVVEYLERNGLRVACEAIASGAHVNTPRQDHN